jgi:NAD(P)-dependent dehydrogenase (short-subunit alcohol dehydrogenase family)
VNISGQAAVVTGGASGLGAQTARALRAEGAHVTVLDRDGERAAEVAREVGGFFARCDVTDPDGVAAALEAAAMPLDAFERIVRVKLIGTFNVTRLATAAMTELEPLEGGERGVVVFTASIAAFDGQVGQAAYSASKGGIVALTLPLARELAQFGVRVMTIAPGVFETPLLGELPDEVKESLAASIPFPRRLGSPADYADLVLSICRNAYLNGETIRLDGALRMSPR